MGFKVPWLAEDHEEGRGFPSLDELSILVVSDLPQTILPSFYDSNPVRSICDIEKLPLSKPRTRGGGTQNLLECIGRNVLGEKRHRTLFIKQELFEHNLQLALFLS